MPAATPAMRPLTVDPTMMPASWRCCGHFCSKGEFRTFGDPVWCGGWLRTGFPGCVYAARLLFRDHLARQHRWHDRRLRHAEVRGRSRSNGGDAVNLDFEFFLASKYF